MAIEITRAPIAPLMDRLFTDAFSTVWRPGSTYSGDVTGFQSLPMNLWETEDSLHAAFSAPGLDESSINVTVHDNVLTVEASTTMQAQDGSKVIWQEFSPASYRRKLRLSTAIDVEKVEAIYKNGLLLVKLPKLEHARPRQVSVQIG